MKTVKHVERRRAFVLETSDLERLVLLLGGDEALSHISVEFSDGSTGTFDHVAEVGEIRNVEGKRIEAVTVECAEQALAWQAKDSPPRYVWVRLRVGLGDTVCWHISGAERDVLSLAGELDEWAGSLVPWYSPLAVLDGVSLTFLSLVAAAAVAVLSLVLQASVPDVLAPGPRLELGVGSLAARLLPLLPVALPLGAAAILIGARHRLFPAATFAIGVEAARDRRAESWRRSVAWATAACGGLALAAGALSGLLG